MAVKCYRELIVWQNAMELVKEICRISNLLPRSEEFGLKSQRRRAAVSILSNIAEGQTRGQAKVFREFLKVAKGPLAELETQVDLSVRLHTVSCEECRHAVQLCEELGKMLHGLSDSTHRFTH